MGWVQKISLHPPHKGGGGWGGSQRSQNQKKNIKLNWKFTEGKKPWERSLTWRKYGYFPGITM